MIPQLNFPEAWIDYLIEFHVHRDYFECHEILEEYWKERQHDGFSEMHWVAWIQLAVGSYHARRANWNGAKKMLVQARRSFEAQPDLVRALGVDDARLLAIMDQMLDSIDLEPPVFYEIEVPINDELLRIKLTEVGPVASSAEIDRSVWEKHRLRDRSDVIAARQEALEKRRIQKFS